MLLLITYEPDPAIPDEPDASDQVQAAIDEKVKAKDQMLPLTGRWLVETNEDVDFWASHLAPVVEPGRLLIVRVRGRTNGLLPADNWDWINPRTT